MFNIAESEFMILDVLHTCRRAINGKDSSRKRPVTYISCRISGASEMYFEDRMLRPDTENYLVCPAGADYKQKYLDEELIAVHLSFTKNPPTEVELIHSTEPRIKELFKELHRCWMQKPPGYVCKCKSILYDIFYCFQAEDPNRYGSKIRASMDYLYAAYLKQDFSIDEMIACSYLSGAYFRRLFKNLYGCTIVEYVSRLRVEYAKSLIMSHQYCIREIAAMCGFSDEKYFSQVFRRIAGCSPSQYYH